MSRVQSLPEVAIPIPAGMHATWEAWVTDAGEVAVYSCNLFQKNRHGVICYVKTFHGKDVDEATAELYDYLAGLENLKPVY